MLAAEAAQAGRSMADRASLLAPAIEGGLDPAVVAGQVVHAVKTECFYVLPHPGVKAAAIERTRRMADGEAPAVSALP